MGFPETQHWICSHEVSKYVYALLCCYGLVIGRFIYFRFINRGDCLNATVMDRTRKGDVTVRTSWVIENDGRSERKATNGVVVSASIDKHNSRVLFACLLLIVVIDIVASSKCRRVFVV